MTNAPPGSSMRLLHALGPGMLLLADRNFPGWELWGMAAGTGADLAWRIKKNLVFTPLRALPDGSFLSVMPTPAENLRLGQARAAGRIPPGPPEGHAVRIIEYTVMVGGAAAAKPGVLAQPGTRPPPGELGLLRVTVIFPPSGGWNTPRYEVQ